MSPATTSSDNQNSMAGQLGRPQRELPTAGSSEVPTLATTPQNGRRPNVSNQRRTPVDHPVNHPTEFIKRIQVSDLAGVAKIEETLSAKSKNWTAWNQSMHLMLDIVDASKYVDGTIKRPSSARDPVGAENWHFNDTYTRVLIAKNIAQSEKCHIQGCESAHDMWNNLRKIHECTSFQIQTEQRRVFRNMKAKDGDVVTHYYLM